MIGKGLLLQGLVLLLGIVVTANAQERPATVSVDAVRFEERVQTVPLLGRLVSPERGEVAALVSGAVEAMQVNVGDRVAAGDEIAIINPARLQARAELALARLKAAEAEVNTEQAQLALLEQERTRLEQLRLSAAFSPARLDDKTKEIAAGTARLARAEALLGEARADVLLAQTDLEDAMIRAPYPGVIVQKYVSAGDYLQVGEPVVGLVNDQRLEIEIDLPSDRAVGLAPQQVVGGTLADGRRLEAVFRALVPDENPLTRTLAARFIPDLRSIEGVVLPGQTVTLDVPAGGNERVLSVAKDALLRRNGGDHVFILANDAAELRRVELGAAVGSRFEVFDGLVEGELVVVRGNERLRPGQPLAVPPAPTAGSPSSS